MGLRTARQPVKASRARYPRIVRAAVGEDAYQAILRLADQERNTCSAVIRRLIYEALQARGLLPRGGGR